MPNRHTLTLLALILAGCSSTLETTESPDRFSFALIGDMPYAESDMPRYEALRTAINSDSLLAWVLHVGDIKTGGTSCSDEYLAQRFDWLNEFKHPFILTPGDNEWTDCHRDAAGGFKPLERLARLRELFYPNVGTSLGQTTMMVDSQADDPVFEEFPENVMWEKSGVVFTTMHIVGSRNGLAWFRGRSVEDDQEVERRMEAAIAWMREAFVQAKAGEGRGLMLTIHANTGLALFARGRADVAFRPFLRALNEELADYNHPVLLAHGDSHYFRIDKPFSDIDTGHHWIQLTRVETFGAGDVHWLRVTVDPDDPNVFSIRQEIVIP